MVQMRHRLIWLSGGLQEWRLGEMRGTGLELWIPWWLIEWLNWLSCYGDGLLAVVVVL